MGSKLAGSPTVCGELDGGTEDVGQVRAQRSNRLGPVGYLPSANSGRHDGVDDGYSEREPC